MQFIAKDNTGAALPAGFADALRRQDARPTVHIYIDFSGLGVDVEVPAEDIISFGMTDKIEGTNGRACSNSMTLELNNYDHRYSSHLPNDIYNPAVGVNKFNGPILSDGRGNLRPGRRIKVLFGLDAYPGVLVEIFEGRIGADGFRENTGKGNNNTVSVSAADYAKLLIDAEPKGERVMFAGGTQWAEKTLSFDNCFISKPSDTANSLIHKIVALGDPDGLITIDAQEILIPITHAPIDGNCWAEIANLCEAVHGVASFSGSTLYFGDSRLYNLPASAIEFTNDDYNNLNHQDSTENIKNKLSLAVSGYKQLGMCALWLFPGSNEFGVVKDGGAVLPLNDPDDMPELFADDVIYKCKYSINPNTPVVAGGTVATASPTSGVPLTQKEAEKYEVVSAKNIGYSFVHSGAGTLALFDTTTLRDSAIIHADKGGLTVTVVNRLVIYGEPVVHREAVKSFMDNDASITLYGKKYQDFESKYVTNESIQAWNGTAMVSEKYDHAWLRIATKRLSVPRKNYEFTCNHPLLLARSGSIVNIIEQMQGSGVNVDARLEAVSIKYDGRKAAWSVSFKASEEEIMAPVTTYTRMGSGGTSNPSFNSRSFVYADAAPDLLTPYKIGDQMIYSDNKLYVATAAKNFGETFSILDWTLVVAANQDQVDDIEDAIAGLSAPTEPGDVASMTVVARQGYVELKANPVYGATASAKAIGYVFQRSKDGGTSWYDITNVQNGTTPVGSLAYAWDFGTDYPEPTLNYGYTPLSSYRFRVKAINSYGLLSLGWLTVSAVDTSSYRTWKPTVPAGGGSRTAMRTAAISWNKEATAYGFLRYEVQIRRTVAPSGGDTNWYSPASGLDIYASELNYKSGVTGLDFDLTGEEWTQSLPLTGQYDGLPVDTTYEFRVRTVLDVPQAADDVPNGLYTSGGRRASAWCTAITALAKATSAADLVTGAVTNASIADGAITAEKINVVNLAAINGLLSSIKGGIADRYNSWKLSDIPGDTDPLGFFRAGNANSFIQSNPEALGTLEDPYIILKSGDNVMKFYSGGIDLDQTLIDKIITREAIMDLVKAGDIEIITGGSIRSGYSSDGTAPASGAGFHLSSSGLLQAMNAKLTGTLRTGIGASPNARVGIRDQTGVAGVTFAGSGNNDLIIVSDGSVAGDFVVKITKILSGYAIGDTGPAGGKIFAIDTTNGLVLETVTVDQSSGTVFSDIANVLSGASETALYSGKRNTDLITAQYRPYEIGDITPSGGIVFYVNGSTYLEAWPTDEAGVNPAAIADRGGTTGWRLPGHASDPSEAIAMYNAKNIIGGFSDVYYATNYTYWYKPAVVWMPAVMMNPAINMATGITGSSSAGQKQRAIRQGVGYKYCAAGGAFITKAFSSGGFSDWHLPSSSELSAMYTNRVAISGPTTGTYWSSTEDNASMAKIVDFATGALSSAQKNASHKVRLVRISEIYEQFQWNKNSGAFGDTRDIKLNETYFLGTNEIEVMFSGRTQHGLGATWSFTQGQMYGLSVQDSSGAEYVKASNGELYAHLTGDVTGNVLGNVTGNVSGSAGSARITGQITVSASNPSGGQNGDIWFKV